MQVCQKMGLSVHAARNVVSEGIDMNFLKKAVSPSDYSLLVYAIPIFDPVPCFLTLSH
jgi:hypothetical protein